MGWTSKNWRKSNHDNFSMEDLKEFIQDEYYRDYQQAMVHFVKDKDEHELYMILRNGHGQTFICATLIHITNGEIFWKDISESEGPRIDRCAVELFKFVPVPQEGYAKEWRERYIANNQKLIRVIM